MSTDEEMIAAVRAMTPPELNTFVAMKLTAIVHTQEECNRTCLARLEVLQKQVATAQEQAQETQVKVARLSGWMKALGLLIGTCLAGVITALAALRK